MKILFALMFLLSVNFSFAQNTNDTTGVTTFEKVEVEASVDAVQWRAHLEKELLPVIERAARKGMKAGRYVVNVRFLVEKDGSISLVQAINDPGYGLAKGAERVVRYGPKWKAGEQNGKK